MNTAKKPAAITSTRNPGWRSSRTDSRKDGAAEEPLELARAGRLSTRSTITPRPISAIEKLGTNTLSNARGVNQGQQAKCHEQTKKRAPGIEEPMHAECCPKSLLGNAQRNQRIARRRSNALADAVDQDHGGDTDERATRGDHANAREGGQTVARCRDVLLAAPAIGRESGPETHQALTDQSVHLGSVVGGRGSPMLTVGELTSISTVRA